MLNLSKPSFLERKRDFHLEAPSAKHEYRLRRYGPMRMAGAVWEETQREKLQKAAKARYRREESIGNLDFAQNDKFGPDDSYDSKEYLSSTPDPRDYRVQ